MGDKKVKVLIIGAGPTGLGAAIRLHQASEDDWCLMEAEAQVGGLAMTDVTGEGFHFDVGGHVIFSHYTYFDDLLECAIGRFGDESKWATHKRESYVNFENKLVPYPFQNNLAYLSEAQQVHAINGLVEAKVNKETNKAIENFDDWIVQTQGEWIANRFMRPYNYKVWGVKPNVMAYSWMSDRIPDIDIKQILENLKKKQGDSRWGPNAVFHFPQHGGTHAIWKAVALLLPQSKLRLSHRLISLNVKSKTALFRNSITGEDVSVRYEHVISTIPLDTILHAGFLKDVEDSDEQALRHYRDGTKQLIHSSTHVIGIGVRGANPHGSKCWLYFPDPNVNFYRATVFSNYAKANVPSDDVLLPTLRFAGGSAIPSQAATKARGGPYWSLMIEVTENTPHKPVNVSTIVQDTIKSCLDVHLLSAMDEIVSIHHRRLEHGYPVPSLERDAILSGFLPRLEKYSIFSRGRFGSYKYEVANQDHSLMLGVECVNRILFNGPEVSLNNCEYINKSGGRKNNDSSLSYVMVAGSKLFVRSNFPLAGQSFPSSKSFIEAAVG